MAAENTTKWNNGWWADVAHKKKSALPTLHNVKKKAAKKKKR